jgi:hypothetical protein
MHRARAFKSKLCSAEAERGADVRARARGPKRATSDKLPELIGRSDPSDAQGSGATSGGTRRAECGDSHLLGENKLGIPRDGGDVRGPTGGRGSPGARRRRGSWPAAKRAMACELTVVAELVHMRGDC